jgi:hypothetical protein
MALLQAANQIRRRLVKLNLLGLSLAHATMLLVSRSTWAGRTGRNADNAPEMLDTDDPQAEALSYSSQSHTTKKSCSNCQLYTGMHGEDFGPCAIFSYPVAPSGKQLVVNAKGWCRAWGTRQEV